MWGQSCCVRNCGRRSHDQRGRRIRNGLTFHCFPAWRTNEGEHTSELTRRRRAAWVAAVDRTSITFDHIPTSARVCSRHFHSGAQRPVVLPWSEVKSLLQSVLQGKPSTSRQMQTKDKSCVQPAAAKTTDLGFRDFFRNALEASLEASNRSSALSRKTSASGSYEVELSFKLPHVTENIQTCESSSSSSSCLNCVQLRRRVSELEEELLHLTAEQDTETSAVVTETLSEWMQPLSPQVVLNGRDVDQHPVVPQNRVTSSSLRPPPRFNKAWLQMFWFLRYCPVRDEMWCQVCRLHADKSYHNLGLIRGSRAFKLHNIKVHRDSSYHKANVERYMLHTSGLQPTDLAKGLSGFTELQ